jgi:hypothetical protein
MRHITVGDKSLLVGDEEADLLVDYAAALANSGRADTVRLSAIGTDGNSVVANFLLDASSQLISETASAVVDEPDNSDAITYMREQMTRLHTTPLVVSTTLTDTEDFTDFGEFADGRAS